MMGDFHIEGLDDRGIMITILSTELTSVYWAELVKAISELHRPNVVIYFDFLYRNGFENRFFSARVNSRFMLEGRLKGCNVSSDLERTANLFFRSHIEILNGSALSSVQRALYMRMLHNIK